MSAARMLLEFALLAYPADFRAQFRADILADVEESGINPVAAAMDVAASGLRMRAELTAHDVAYAARRLRRMPLFVTIVALTFALGIGVNVAVFSILNAVLLRPLPYADAGNLVVFRFRNEETSQLGADISVPELQDFSHARSFSDVGGVVRAQATLTGAGKPVMLAGADVTPPVFAALGIPPQLGRFLQASDERKGTHSVVLSDKVWRRDFGAAPDAVGKSIMLDGTAFTIVGIAPAHFEIPLPDSGQLQELDYYDVQPDTGTPNQRGAQYVGAVARLNPGNTVASANAELALISKQLQRAYPVEAGLLYYVRPLDDVVFGDFTAGLWTLVAAAAGILIITCANVSNMLLSTASSRDREFTLRSALGASSRRLAEQLLVETGLLASIGGIVGIGVAYGSLALVRPALASFPRAQSIGVDGWALVYCLALVVVTALLAGFWPMRSIAKQELAQVLKSAGRGGDSSASNRARAALVVVEISLALALVALSGLMVRSYFLMTQSAVGIDTKGLFVSAQLTLPSQRFPALADRSAFHRRLLASLQALPGVDAATLALNYPLSNIHFGFDVGIVGRHFAPGSEPIAGLNIVSPGYFETMKLQVSRGRAFTDTDTGTSLPVALVNESFERKFAPAGGALGMRLITAGVNGTKQTTRTVVGVVPDVRTSLTRPTQATYFVPMSQAPIDFFVAMFRSNRLTQAALQTEVDGAIAATDPQMASPAIQSFDDVMSDATAQRRSAALLLGCLAAVAMLLALTGIFGVVSYAVTQRYREFGVRIALGASARDILADVLRRALILAGAGIAGGLAIAAAGARAIEAQLYQLSPFDPFTFVAVVVLLLASAIVAALLPAIRATRIDPVVALRYE